MHLGCEAGQFSPTERRNYLSESLRRLAATPKLTRDGTGEAVTPEVQLSCQHFAVQPGSFTHLLSLFKFKIHFNDR